MGETWGHGETIEHGISHIILVKKPWHNPWHLVISWVCHFVFFFFLYISGPSPANSIFLAFHFWKLAGHLAGSKSLGFHSKTPRGGTDRHSTSVRFFAEPGQTFSIVLTRMGLTFVTFAFRHQPALTRISGAGEALTGTCFPARLLRTTGGSLQFIDFISSPDKCTLTRYGQKGVSAIQPILILSLVFSFVLQQHFASTGDYSISSSVCRQVWVRLGKVLTCSHRMILRPHQNEDGDRHRLI